VLLHRHRQGDDVVDKVLSPTVAGGASSSSAASIILSLAMACITSVATVDVGADDPSIVARSVAVGPSCAAGRAVDP